MTRKSSVKKTPRKSTKSSAKKLSPRDVVLAYDLGGTKVAVGVVDRAGRIIEEIREPVVYDQGKKAVIQQLADLGSALISRHREIRRVGMASAGPLTQRRACSWILRISRALKGPGEKLPSPACSKRNSNFPSSSKTMRPLRYWRNIGSVARKVLITP